MSFSIKILKQTVWQILSRFSSTISGILILSIIARNYGKEGLGVFSLAFIYILFFHSLIDFGINAHAVKDLQRNYHLEKWRKLLGARIIGALFLIILAGIILVLLPSSGFSQDFKLSSFIGLPTILFVATKLTNLSLMQAKLKYQLDFLPTILGSTTSVFIIVYLAYLRLPVYFLMLGYLASFFIQAILPLIINRIFFGTFLPIFDFRYFKNLIHKTWPLAGTLVLNIIYFRSDAFLVSSFKGSSDVGLYNLAYQFFQTILIIPTFIMNALYPHLLKSFKKSSTQFDGQIKVASITLFFLAISASIVTFIFSPLLIYLAAGSGFSGSVLSLKILLLGFPAFFLSSLLMWLIIIKNLYKQMFLLYLIGLIFNFILNMIFIPKYSFYAASFITVISEYLILVLQAVVLWVNRKK